MPTNLERYRSDLDRLTNSGSLLLASMLLATAKRSAKDIGLTDEQAKQVPIFDYEYQVWYSEALACISQLPPSRVEDFVSYYKSDKPRKDITYANYTISDYLKGLTITIGAFKDKVVGPDAAIPAFRQQVEIVKSATQRLESSLFDIKTLLQADLFDNELEIAGELNRKGFHRGAGAIAGVVLEGHLSMVCHQHKITIAKILTSVT